MDNKKEEYSLKNTIFKAKHTFILSYLSWLYAQNPSFFERFSTEEIINYMNNIQIPWCLSKLKNDNPLEWYATIYSLIDENKKNADIFSCSTQIVPNVTGVDFSFPRENIQKATFKQVNYLKKLNNSRKLISNEEIDNMDLNLTSLSISLLKR